MERPKERDAVRRQAAGRILGIALSILFLLSAFEATTSFTQFTSAFEGKPSLAPKVALANNAAASQTDSSNNTTSTSAFTTSSSLTSTTFTEVSIYNETTLSHDRIGALITDGTIPGTIFVKSSGTTSTGYGTFEQVVLFSVGTSLTITLIAQDISGPMVVLLNISKNSFLNVQSGYVDVALDNMTVAETSSLGALLASDATPSYIILSTFSGFELLLSIPHFSTHKIVVMTPEFNGHGAPSSSSVLTSYIVGALVVAIVVLVVAFVIRSLRGKGTTRARAQSRTAKATLRLLVTRQG